MIKLAKTTIAMALAIILVPASAFALQSAQEAIDQAQTMATLEEKTDYLIQQGNQFLVQDQHQDAREVADYVLTRLDRDSEEARQILQEAREETRGDFNANINNDLSRDPAVLPDEKVNPIDSDIRNTE